MDPVVRDELAQLRAYVDGLAKQLVTLAEQLADVRSRPGQADGQASQPLVPGVDFSECDEYGHDWEESNNLTEIVCRVCGERRGQL
jgi:hypothetical protein